MNTDSGFHIGKTHAVCQDYVINGYDDISKLHYIFLADGCSSSPQTDVGARVLCHAAKSQLIYRHSSLLDIDEQRVIDTSHVTCNMLGIPNTCLDATFISMLSNEEEIGINIIGDGAVALKDKNNIIRIISFHYDKNFPFYLNYKHNSNSEIFKQWKEMSPAHSFNVSVLEQESSIKTQDNPYLLFAEEDNVSTIIVGTVQTFIKLCTEHYNYVAILSDGIGSFYQIDEQGKTHEFTDLDVIHDVLDFKNTNGKFAKRRLNKFKRKCEKEGIYHYDDISLGVINLV
jgi:hypothetical protein